MTGRALTRIVIRGFLTAVARFAIRRPNCGMIKGDVLPGRCIVTGRTLPGIVIGGFHTAVARLTVRRPNCRMIKGGVFPG